jgi:hypothetical protein
MMMMKTIIIIIMMEYDNGNNNTNKLYLFYSEIIFKDRKMTIKRHNYSPTRL